MLLQAPNPSGTCTSEQPFRACTQGCRHHRWGEKSPNFGFHTMLHPSPMVGARNVEQDAAERPTRTSPSASNSPGGYGRIRPRKSCSSLGSAMGTHHRGLWVPGSGHGALRKTPGWDLALLFLHSAPTQVNISAWKLNLPKTLHLAKNALRVSFPPGFGGSARKLGSVAAISVRGVAAYTNCNYPNKTPMGDTVTVPKSGLQITCPRRTTAILGAVLAFWGGKLRRGGRSLLKASHVPASSLPSHDILRAGSGAEGCCKLAHAAAG